MKLDPEQIKRLAKLTVDAKPPHVNCEDWLHMLGEYVEAAQRGEPLTSERFLVVREHARDCPPCMQELRALEELLDAEES